MRKALLIGTTIYQDGFKPLNSVPHDVEALADLLRHPEIGGFHPDEVQTLINCESGDLSAQIENWYLQHTKDDFALLFIAGHGVKDGDRKLHFVTTNTQKIGEQLRTATAVAASNLSDWLRKSKAKRQIVILNCCFSGAFGDLVPMDEGAIAVEEVLGAEGRVVMTSTSSMDYAFERQNGKFSVYGHYLIEGLRTGAAAAKDSDEITIDELHQYVSRKVQEEAPAMVPQLFAKGESCRLRIAKVAIGDPEVKYRKKVEEIIQEDGDEIDEIFSRPILEELGTKLQLHKATITAIEFGVIEPIRQRNAKRQKYSIFFQRAVQHLYPFGVREQKRIFEYRKILGLGNEEYGKIEQSVLQLRMLIESDEIKVDNSSSWLQSDKGKTTEVVDITQKNLDPEGIPTIISTEIAGAGAAAWTRLRGQHSDDQLAKFAGVGAGALAVTGALAKLQSTDIKAIAGVYAGALAGRRSTDANLSATYVPTNPQSGERLQGQDPIDRILFESEKKIDYCRLRDLLKAGKWEEADRETLAVMLQAANRKSEGWLDANSLKQFPCEDLKTIDQLWSVASNGHFGFNVQKQIWEECGSPIPGSKDWKRFCVKVGWQDFAANVYVNYSDLKKNTEFSPAGELPFVGWFVGGEGWSVLGCAFLAQRLVGCSTR